jgi:hypothetical protein
MIVIIGSVILGVALWGFPAVLFFIAGRPYFNAVSRIIVAATIWSVSYGVIGTITYGGPVIDVPPRLVIGFVYMGVSIACLEGIAYGFERRRLLPSRPFAHPMGKTP